MHINKLHINFLFDKVVCCVTWKFRYIIPKLVALNLLNGLQQSYNSRYIPRVRHTNTNSILIHKRTYPYTVEVHTMASGFYLHLNSALGWRQSFQAATSQHESYRFKAISDISYDISVFHFLKIRFTRIFQFLYSLTKIRSLYTIYCNVISWRL